jgi:hypothetical protein
MERLNPTPLHHLMPWHESATRPNGLQSTILPGVQSNAYGRASLAFSHAVPNFMKVKAELK